MILETYRTIGSHCIISPQAVDPFFPNLYDLRVRFITFLDEVPVLSINGIVVCMSSHITIIELIHKSCIISGTLRISMMRIYSSSLFIGLIDLGTPD